MNKSLFNVPASDENKDVSVCVCVYLNVFFMFKERQKAFILVNAKQVRGVN